MVRSKILKTAFSSYEIGSVIGEGGAGRVYKATDQSGNVFAIKILDSRKVSEVKLKRFKNEILFGLQNKHPNIIRIFDHGHHAEGEEGTPFFVMPFYDKTLRQLLETGIPQNEVLTYFGQLIDGVEAAHLQKIVHRDLKPENILYDQITGNFVVADFGIAHFEEEDLYTAVETANQERLANFQYAAPEQRRRGQAIDYRADIFAAGLILNEMFTGEVAQGTEYSKIKAIADEYAYLDEIVELMIRHKPDDRPESFAKVKSLLIGHKNKFITQQRISKLRNTVISENEIDDPLIADPIQLVDFDYIPGRLTLKLNQPVNDQWQYAFQNFGGYTSVGGKPPRAFELKGDEASIPCNEQDATRVVEHFKDWLPKANLKYEQLVRAAHKKQIEKQRGDLQRKVELEEEKKRVFDNLTNLIP